MPVPLVLLPGLHGTPDLFAPLARLLPPTLAPRLISHASDPALTYATLYDDLLPRLPEEPFVLLAESFSGPLAIRIAANHPDLVRALILVATFATPPVSTFLRFFPLTLLFCFPHVPAVERYLLCRRADPSVYRDLRRTLAGVPPAVLAARLRQVLSVDVTADVERLISPTLYLRATRDRLIPRRALDTLLAFNPAITVAEIPAPHLLLQSAPAEAWSAIGSFLRTLPGRSDGPLPRAVAIPQWPSKSV